MQLRTTTHHWPPPHSASCLGASAVFVSWLDEKEPPAQVAEGDATTCASRLSALVPEWKSITSTSCNWWQPPPEQVECLHQLKEGNHLTSWPWTLCLWCFPSFNWCKHSTCSGGGCHQLQLALKVLFHSATSADSPLAHIVVSPSATCAGGSFSSSHWRKYCTYTRATCTVWLIII